MRLRELLADERQQRERIWRRLAEARLVPIGAIVFELERTWPAHRWRVSNYALRVWARLPTGELLVAPEWSDGWTHLRTISDWARRLPNNPALGR